MERGRESLPERLLLRVSEAAEVLGLSRRSIHLALMAIEALKRHRIREHELRFSTGPDWDEQGWVFCNGVGRPIEAGHLLNRSFRPLLVKAGLSLIRFLDLRHSVATLLLTAGTHPKIVQELLGHSQITLTLNGSGSANR